MWPASGVFLSSGCIITELLASRYMLSVVISLPASDFAPARWSWAGPHWAWSATGYRIAREISHLPMPCGSSCIDFFMRHISHDSSASRAHMAFTAIGTLEASLLWYDFPIFVKAMTEIRLARNGRKLEHTVIENHYVEFVITILK